MIRAAGVATGSPLPRRFGSVRRRPERARQRGTSPSGVAAQGPCEAQIRTRPDHRHKPGSRRNLRYDRRKPDDGPRPPRRRDVRPFADGGQIQPGPGPAARGSRTETASTTSGSARSSTTSARSPSPTPFSTSRDRFSEKEWEKIRLHPALGYGLIKEIKLVPEVGNIILYHHEHYDGSGYPQGLSGDAIPSGGADFRPGRRAGRDHGATGRTAGRPSFRPRRRKSSGTPGRISIPRRWTPSAPWNPKMGADPVRDDLASPQLRRISRTAQDGRKIGLPLRAYGRPRPGDSAQVLERLFVVPSGIEKAEGAPGLSTADSNSRRRRASESRGRRRSDGG